MQIGALTSIPVKDMSPKFSMASEFPQTPGVLLDGAGPFSALDSLECLFGCYNVQVHLGPFILSVPNAVKPSSVELGVPFQPRVSPFFRAQNNTQRTTNTSLVWTSVSAMRQVSLAVGS